MHAMVLAAGVGSRLDPLTRTTCKPLVPVANRPCVDHLLDLLRQHGFDQVLLNLHYFGEELAHHLHTTDRPGMTLRLEHEDRLWGDAGSIKRYADFFADTFLVIGGDDLCDFDLRALVQFHRDCAALGTIGLYEVEDPSQYGVARVDADGRVLEFAEKPDAAAAAPFETRSGAFLANTGIYIFQPAVLDLIPAGVEHLLGRQVLPALRERGELRGMPCTGYWTDIGAPDEYRQANRACLDGAVSVRPTQPEVRHGIFLSPAATVDPAATLEPPVLIGAGCEIGPAAVVGPHTLLGDGCRIGAGAVVGQSILWRDVQVDAGAHLYDSVVTDGARVGPGSAVFGASIIPAGSV